jgi:hypothetical protein
MHVPRIYGFLKDLANSSEIGHSHAPRIALYLLRSKGLSQIESRVTVYLWFSKGLSELSRALQRVSIVF